MIKLSFHNGSESTTHQFDKEVVTIGYGPSDQVDLVLPDSNLEREHVKIVRESDRFTVFNSANDPFVALNGLPFAKQKIVNGDRIEIGRSKVYFEEESAVEDPPEPADTEPEVVTVEPKAPAVKKVPVKKEVHIFEEEEEKAPVTKTQKSQTAVEPLSPEKRWSMVLKIVIPGITLILLAALISYLQFSDESKEQEIAAAKGLADIGMALTYTQVIHLKPVQQHWAKPSFLEEIFAEVIGQGFDPLASIDAQGNFNNSDYFLRIYTGLDSAQFIAIAQPTPSLMQWLIPKSAFIVDSTTMKMHRVSDLKALNRILVNAQAIDPLTAKKIASILDKTKPISIHELVDSEKSNGFQPPEQLDKTTPGADLLIYNAPRYYPFGERILSRAIQLQRGEENQKEMALLQQEMEAITSLPNIILYASHGKEEATEAYQALHTLFPDSEARQSSFHLAFLELDPQGKIITSHFLTDPQPEEEDHLATINPRVSPQPTIETPVPQVEDPSVDAESPLYVSLRALVKERQEALSPTADKITQLIHLQAEGSVPDFSVRIQEMLTEFTATSQEQQRKMTSGLSQLFQEYSTLPPSEFMNYIEATGLQTFVDQILKDHESTPGE